MRHQLRLVARGSVTARVAAETMERSFNDSFRRAHFGVHLKMG